MTPGRLLKGVMILLLTSKPERASLTITIINGKFDA